MTAKKKAELPKGFVAFGGTLKTCNGIKVGDWIVPHEETWGPGQVVKILAPWTNMVANGLQQMGPDVVAAHQIRNGSHNPGTSQWNLARVKLVSAEVARAMENAMLMETSELLSAFRYRGCSGHEANDEAYASEIDRRIPRTFRR